MNRNISIKQSLSGAEITEFFSRVEFVETEVRLGDELLLKKKEPYQRYEGSELQRCIEYLLYGVNKGVTNYPLNDTQKQDKPLCQSLSFETAILVTPPAKESFQGCDVERQNAYQDPILAKLHQDCMWLDREVRRLQARDKGRPRLSQKHPKSLEQCVLYQTQSLVSLLSVHLLPKMQKLLNDNKK